MLQFVTRCLLVLAVSATLCSAQVPVRSIHGTVRDRTGAVVLGARVTVRGTSSQQSTTTMANGDFRFEGVLQGEITLTVEAPGFARFERGMWYWCQRPCFK